MPETLHTSVEICEALVRHVETTGSEVFEKNFHKGGKTICTIWCMVGPNAELFKEMIHDWLDKNGFTNDA